MKIARFAILLASIVSVSGERVVCAYPDQTEVCKRIEASGKDVRCLRVADSVDCLRKIITGSAHFGTFTPEEAMLASRHAGDAAEVVAELRHSSRSDEGFAFETVAVVSRNHTGGLAGLENATYCHPGFAQGRYWSDRVLKYFETRVIRHVTKDIIHVANRPLTADEEELQKLSSVFRKACRPGAWSVSDWWDKKLKRDFSSLCAKCDFPSTCSYKSDGENEHFAALNCLTKHGGAVAYTALSYVRQYFNLDSSNRERRANPDEYRYLCEDGSTRELTSEACTWIRQPWTIVVSQRSAAKEVTDLLKETAIPDPSFSTWKTALKKILNVDGRIINFAPGNRNLTEYLRVGREIPDFDPKARQLSWCTIDETEKSKCEYLATAALSFGVPIQINCTQAESKIDCLRKIANNKSDVTFIDTQLGFAARKVYGLTPAAFVETEKTGNYYGVVVTKRNGVTRFRDLKGKSACFPVYNGLGWLSHVQNVRRLNLVPSMLCSDSHGLWNYFGKACAPGAKSPDINKFNSLTPKKLCEACINTGKDEFCYANRNNPYYSEIGALRCLNNEDGDVAILDYHAIKRIFESDSNETKGMNLNDFKILCRDETIGNFRLDDPQECSISQLNGGEVVMRDNLPLNEKRDIALTLITLDDLFGHSMKEFPPTFKMFEPFDGVSGLLFKDTAVALISIYSTHNEYVNNYLKLQSEMSSCYRDNRSDKIYISLLVILPALILIFIDK